MAKYDLQKQSLLSSHDFFSFPFDLMVVAVVSLPEGNPSVVATTCGTVVAEWMVVATLLTSLLVHYN